MPRKCEACQASTGLTFSCCAEVIGETGADIGYEQFIDPHPALRALLLIKVGEESVQRRKAAIDRVVPDLRLEESARSFHLVDDPGETDRQRIGFVHRPKGDVARPAEGLIQADREPRFL